MLQKLPDEKSCKHASTPVLNAVFFWPLNMHYRLQEMIYKILQALTGPEFKICKDKTADYSIKRHEKSILNPDPCMLFSKLSNLKSNQ